MLSRHSVLVVRQIKELAELIGFETRNKYQILTESGNQVAFAAEESQGMLGMMSRQMFGHWRDYTIRLLHPDLTPILELHHPFRFLLHRLRILAHDGTLLGAIQERWSFLHKHFDVLDTRGEAVFLVRSPLHKLWTFTFMQPDGQEAAVVNKQWSGALKEVFTDADNFRLEYIDRSLSNDQKLLILAAALFIDLRYFERKARS